MNAEGLIQFEEGRKTLAYVDSLGFWSNGIGHKYADSLSHEGDVWSDARIDSQFAQDYGDAFRGVVAQIPWFATLDEVRQAYVISMAFQMGIDGLMQFQHTLQAMRDQRWNDAAGGIRASLWHRQTFLRAERCARAVETGEWQS